MYCYTGYARYSFGRLNKSLLGMVGYDEAQLVVISGDSAYGDYESCCFGKIEQDFKRKVCWMKELIEVETVPK